MLLDIWPHDADARRLTADALFRQSELSSPPWNPRLAGAALAAYDRLPPSAKSDLGVLAAVAALRLKAFDDRAGAARAVAQFRHPTNAPVLSPAHREVLAAVQIAGGKFEEAIEVLERAINHPDVTVGCWVQLALAYHATGRWREACFALDQAMTLPDWSSRERAEWLAARRRVYGGP